MFVVKRQGKSESVKFDKITARIEKLCYGLDRRFVNSIDVAKKVIEGLYDGVTTTELDSLNRESDEQAAERLRACNAAPRWIAQVLTGRPYPDVDSLLDTAERAARALDWAEVQQALDAHPRIGERAEGASTEAQWSRREQAAVGTSATATRDALRTGNAEYERRFGHVFLIRAAGRSAEETLAKKSPAIGPFLPSTRPAPTTPAQLTSRLRPPMRDAAASIVELTSASEVTSQRRKEALAPNVVAAAWPGPSWTSTRTTLPPLAAM